MIEKPKKERRKRHKMTIECDISLEVRKAVKERDINCCICCGSPSGVEIAHYVPRSQGGLGIPENLVCLCKTCHKDFDGRNEHFRTIIQAEIKTHLKQHYPNWDKSKLVYDKWKILSVDLNK